MAQNYQALAGTVNPSFRIGGANGLNINQGFVNPNTANIIGNDGDVYVLLGSSATIFQWIATEWVALSTNQDFIRTKVIGNSFIATNNLLYLGITTPGATIFLPAGTENKRFVIKDETGQAFSSPISIQPLIPDTIDGQTSTTINVNYGSLTMIYGDSSWFLI